MCKLTYIVDSCPDCGRHGSTREASRRLCSMRAKGQKGCQYSEEKKPVKGRRCTACEKKQAEKEAAAAKAKAAKEKANKAKQGQLGMLWNGKRWVHVRMM